MITFRQLEDETECEPDEDETEDETASPDDLNDDDDCYQ